VFGLGTKIVMHHPQSLTALQSRPSRISAAEREYILRQSRCLDALNEYFAEARKTLELVRLSRAAPLSIAERLELIAQRDREAEAQSSFVKARKLLLHTVKLSCTAAKTNRLQ
jgi:hypothetical protein